MSALVTRDLDDLEHDDRVIRENKAEDTRLVNPARPCPMPEMCKWEHGECKTCGKRRVDPMTVRLLEISLAMRGGMPVAQDQLCAAQWMALGRIRAKQGGLLG